MEERISQRDAAQHASWEEGDVVEVGLPRLECHSGTVAHQASAKCAGNLLGQRCGLGRQSPQVIAELVVELAEVEAVGAGSGVEVGAEH